MVAAVFDTVDLVAVNSEGIDGKESLLEDHQDLSVTPIGWDKLGSVVQHMSTVWSRCVKQSGRKFCLLSISGIWIWKMMATRQVAVFVNDDW